MKKVFGIISIISLGLLFACSKPVNDDHASKTSEWQEKKVTIDLNECENMIFGTDHLKICLDSVADSRCPLDVVCIWEGRAIAKFTFIKNGQSYPITLTIPGFASYSQEISVAGYTIRLINVLPYPVINSPQTAETTVKIEIKNY